MQDDTIYVLVLEPTTNLEREMAVKIHQRLPDENDEVISLLGNDGTLRISYQGD